MRIKLPLLVLVSIMCFSTQAQKNKSEFDDIDQKVQAFGPLNTLNVATIADTISRQFTDKKAKARAYYYWIAHNISIDGKAARANDQKKSNPEQVIQARKATPLGFAKLFQEMCSMGNIRCLVVDGYVKNQSEDINNPPDEVNHSWNVVQLGKSPEEWHYVDVTRASGYLDKRQIAFTASFTSEYFFAERSLFNLDHFPDNSAWMLGEGPKGRKDFYALAVIGAGAYEIGLRKPNPLTGMIRTNIKNSVQFSFLHNGKHSFQGINLIIGEGSKQLKPEPMNFTDDGSSVRFSYQFKKDDTYAVKIEADGKIILQYIVEVSE